MAKSKREQYDTLKKYQKKEKMYEHGKRLVGHHKKSERTPHKSKAKFEYPTDDKGNLTDNMGQYLSLKKKPEGRIYTSSSTYVTPEKRTKKDIRDDKPKGDKFKRTRIGSKHPRKDGYLWQSPKHERAEGEYKKRTKASKKNRKES